MDHSAERRNRKHEFEQQTTKPTPLPVMPDGIPASMKARAQWVVWAYTRNADKGKWDKPPTQAKRPGAGASSTDPATWATFSEAMATYQRGGFDGIGYVLADDEVGIDLDNVRDPETDRIEPWAVEIINAIASYAEVSPSATGAKVIAKGILEKGRKFTHIGAEMYSQGRYFTMTGHVISEHSSVEDRQDEINAVYKTMDERNEAAERVKAKPTRKKSAEPAASTSPNLTDEELIVKASSANGTGAKFRAFMNGDASDQKSASEADLAFCNLIVFWTDDADQVRRIVRQSGLNREKWERDDYAERTIKKAFEGRRNRYDPHYRSNGQASHERDRQAGAGEKDDPAEADHVCLTDTGNAKRFASDHGKIVRYCHPWGKWLIWDGTRWRQDDSGYAKALAKKTVLRLYASAKAQIDLLAADKGDDEEKAARLAAIKAVLAHALRSQDARRINAILDLARSEEGIPVPPDKLDSDIWLWNCTNGTLDLRTGKLKAHDQADYITKLCPVPYDPNATCPNWQRFLFEILKTETMVAYKQRLNGYWLTGRTDDHVLPVLWGVGANGKSTEINTIFAVMGPDYSGKAHRDLLLAVKGDRHPTALAWLHGKRFVACIETGDGARLDEALVKELTGGDTVTARRMREDFWTFQPTHKIALVTNHKPTVKGTDFAIWRRLRLIPYTVVFPENKQDKRLPEKLRAELAGILAWMVQGCLTWQQHGLADPPEIVAATAEYRSAEDRLGEFLAERCQLNPEFRAKASDLYAAFKDWSKANGEPEMSGKAFGDAMVERGFHKDAGKRWYLGLVLTAQNEENHEE